MELHAYLNFNGTCAEAFRFYERCFEGKIEMLQTHGESPMRDQVPPEWHGRVLHARLVAGNGVLMGSDAPPDAYAPPQGIHVAMQVPTAALGEQIFSSLAEGGTVTMPFQKTFWSPGFGMVVDRFGIPWIVNAQGAQELAAGR